MSGEHDWEIHVGDALVEVLFTCKCEAPIGDDFTVRDTPHKVSCYECDRKFLVTVAGIDDDWVKIEEEAANEK